MSAAKHLQEAIDVGCTRDDHDHIASFRAEVIAERDAQIVAWLAKKAGEYGTSNRENRAKAEAVGRMADKLSRGAVRDDETGVSELYRLRSENNRLLAQLAEVSGARDAWHDWADALAYKVAPVEVLGRHGEDGKFPWSDALDLITPAADVEKLRGRVAELEAERQSTNEELSKAVERVAELEARPSRATVLREAAKVAHIEGDRLYDEADVEEAKAAWGVAVLLGRMADEADAHHPSEGELAARHQQAEDPHDSLPRFSASEIARWQARQQEDPHDSPLHHDYAVGRDLPTTHPTDAGSAL